jgi:hypothetical protein
MLLLLLRYDENRSGAIVKRAIHMGSSRELEFSESSQFARIECMDI